MKRVVIFFIGTEAELIKVFPIMIELEKRGMEYLIIASGQNDIESSRILAQMNRKVDFALDRDTHITTGVQLIKWWFKIYIQAKHRIKKRFKDIDFKRSVMIVHGDTVSTVMGAFIGKRLKMEVSHVEAGLRSYHLFNPLPEEIDRIVTSMFSDVHFAPGDIPERNLAKARGKVINTRYNTLYDSLRYAKEIQIEDKQLSDILEREYFVFVLHRQENLMRKKFVCDVVKKIEKLAEDKHCVILLHNITANTFRKFDLMSRLETNKNITLLPRVNYFDFMKLLDGSQYVISDGGSNQEELYYMGKPCLIMRKSTERDEGVGHNGIMFDGKIDMIEHFAQRYMEYSKSKPYIEESPSEIIVDYLESESVLIK